MTELQWSPIIPQTVKCKITYALAYIQTCNKFGVPCTKTLLCAYYLHFIHYSHIEFVQFVHFAEDIRVHGNLNDG